MRELLAGKGQLPQEQSAAVDRIHQMVLAAMEDEKAAQDAAQAVAWAFARRTTPDPGV